MSTTTSTEASEFLNTLLTRAYDAEQGYEVAAEAAENDALKDWLQTNSEQRRTFGKNIKRHLADLGAEPDKGASITGKFHQAFIKLRSAVSGETDIALIEECRRGELQALEDYADLEAKVELRTDALKTINDQSEQVRTQLNALDSIETALQPAT